MNNQVNDFNKVVVRYLIAVEPGDDTYATGIVVPDIPGCFSACDTAEKVIPSITSAITLHLEGLSEDGLAIPLPKEPHVHLFNPDYSGFVWRHVDIDIGPYLTRHPAMLDGDRQKKDVYVNYVKALLAGHVILQNNFAHTAFWFNWADVIFHMYKPGATRDAVAEIQWRIDALREHQYIVLKEQTFDGSYHVAIMGPHAQLNVHRPLCCSVDDVPDELLDAIDLPLREEPIFGFKVSWLKSLDHFIAAAKHESVNCPIFHFGEIYPPEHLLRYAAPEEIEDFSNFIGDDMSDLRRKFCDWLITKGYEVRGDVGDDVFIQYGPDVNDDYICLFL